LKDQLTPSPPVGTDRKTSPERYTRPQVFGGGRTKSIQTSVKKITEKINLCQAAGHVHTFKTIHLNRHVSASHTDALRLNRSTYQRVTTTSTHQHNHQHTSTLQHNVINTVIDTITNTTSTQVNTVINTMPSTHQIKRQQVNTSTRQAPTATLSRCLYP
jgi:hypothetical protein